MTCTRENFKPLRTNEEYSFSIVLVLPTTHVKSKEKFPENFVTWIAKKFS